MSIDQQWRQFPANVVAACSPPDMETISFDWAWRSDLVYSSPESLETSLCQVSTHNMAEYLGRLFSLRADIDRLLEYFSKNANQSELLESGDRQLVLQNARTLQEFFAAYGFNNAERAANRIQEKQRALTPANVRERFDELWDDFMRDGSERHIEIIDADKFKSYGAGFSPEVDNKFPEATREIREAGTCYALGRNTACVFHLMRAVEHGIRALAIASGVPTDSRAPLDYLTWERLLNGIRDVVESPSRLNGWGLPARSAFKAFYHPALADFLAFKDECRNLVMHTRSGLYNQHEAASWLLKVSSFFQRLATKISENSTTTLLNEREWL